MGGVGKAENAGVKKTEFLMRALNEKMKKPSSVFDFCGNLQNSKKYYFSDKKWGMQKKHVFWGCEKTLVFGGNLFFDGTGQ